LTRVRGLLVSLLRGWKERSASSAMAMDISNKIVPIEELLPLEWYRKSKQLRKRIVKKSLKSRITL